MFDNLRRQAIAQTEEDEADDLPSAPAERRVTATRVSAGGRVLGMTPQQIFILSLMLFLNVTVLSCFALVVFERIRLF